MASEFKRRIAKLEKIVDDPIVEIDLGNTIVHLRRSELGKIMDEIDGAGTGLPPPKRSPNFPRN